MSGATADSPDSRAGEPGTVLTLVRAMIIKRLTIMVRYRANLLAQVITVYLFFAVLFFGGRAVMESTGAGMGSMESTLDGFMVGWFLFTMAQSAYFGLPGSITKESEWGTLEQLYLSPYRFGTVMSSMIISNLIQSVIMGFVILGLMLLTTGRTLAVDVVTIVPVIILGLLSVVGIGFVFAGLALIYKRIENVSQLMQFAIVGLISAPAAEIPELRYLPLVQGSGMLQETMRNGMRLWEFSAVDWLVLVGVAVAYLTAGFAVFRYCEYVARNRGVMGHY